ncbi:MAG: hypothetical protein JJE04_03100 [Acidobacteriia bacterium]|nr:hypothetical protein [Terriglobia bacterium]
MSLMLQTANDARRATGQETNTRRRFAASLSVLRLLPRVLALGGLLAGSSWAQCVMCSRTAAAQNAARVEVLQQGIVILLIPPVTILTGFLVLAYRRRQA